jgi:hypothetical protein
MACPICDHTMQGIAGANRVFLCPRCGTLKDCGQRASAGLSDEVRGRADRFGISEPKLIHQVYQLIRAIDFEQSFAPFDPGGKYRDRVSRRIRDLAESIGLSEER